MWIEAAICMIGKEVKLMCHTVSGKNMGAAGSVCGCGCGCAVTQRRHFSKEEKLEMLHSYEDELGKEIKGVQERIQELEEK
jgi:hypothetical protein